MTANQDGGTDAELQQQFARIFRMLIDRWTASDTTGQTTMREVASRFQMDESILSRLRNGKPPRDTEFLLQVLAKFNSPAPVTRTLMLLCLAIHGGPNTRRELMSLVESPLRDDLLLEEAKTAKNLLPNILADSGVDWGSKERRISRKVMAPKGQRLDSQELVERLVKLSETMKDDDQDVVAAISGLSISRAWELFAVYRNAIAIDFHCHQVLTSDKNNFLYTLPFMTIALGAIGPDDPPHEDEAHEGTHLMFLVRGGGILTTPDGQLELDATGRRLAIFSASRGRHGMRATVEDTEVLVLTLNPPTFDRWDPKYRVSTLMRNILSRTTET